MTVALATATSAPWWAVLAAEGLTAAVSPALTALSTLFLQNSADRLAWWNSYLNRCTPARPDGQFKPADADRRGAYLTKSATRRRRRR
ncbi:hypothetical protein [Streptomyces sp. NBC_00056]|uniref:hypothetical protein n=1 Tax=Streptomyces sp. NBC_00056 TaxID=2975633 RepID=UPI003D80834A